MIKKFAKYISLLITFIFLTCCQNINSHKGGDNSDSSDVKDSTVIYVGTLSQSISYYEKNDRTMGYEYELAENFAKDQHKKTKYILGKDENDLVNKLKKGEIDFIAYPIVMSNKNRQDILFTNHTYITHQVLVQRIDEQPVSTKKSKAHKNKKKKSKKTKKTQKEATKEPKKNNMVKDVTQLAGKEVWVIKGSKHEERLKNLNDEIGGGIIIKTCDNQEDEEDLIDHVSKKEIDYMVCDEKIARANSSEYNNIDLGTNISFDQRAAWATTDSTMLKQINKWEEEKNTQELVKALQTKYFSRHLLTTARLSIKINKIPKGSHEISNYDPYFRQYGKQFGLDWRLIAAIAQKESGFNPGVTGWSGSIGLMQLMPITGKRYGIGNKEDLFDPEINVKIACKHLKDLCAIYKNIGDAEERMKFTIATYNAGIGHIKDAQALAKKYGKDPNKWEDNVEPFVRLKSNRKYYSDPVVKHGYANGNSISNYVARIEAQFHEYKSKVK